MKKIKSIVILAAMWLSATGAFAQIVHSHNDYERTVPFYEAYAAQAGSIEVDIHLYKNTIRVCHDKKDVASAKTIEELYLDPIRKLAKEGKPIEFILLVDNKGDLKTLDKLVDILSDYKDITKKINLIISGNTPPAESFGKYPAYLSFDGTPKSIEGGKAGARIGMISCSLQDFTSWNGKGSIPATELRGIEAVIASAHQAGKKIRFWGAPDNVNGWITLSHLGVDIVNTDKVAACCKFFSELPQREYTLASPQGSYTPLYKIDENATPKNVILIIGDGMSITQIAAAETANRGELSLLNIRNIGFQKTASTNSYNTDSAGAGSALATGHKTNNRYISTLADGTIVENTTEFFTKKGVKTGVITSGDVTDATPAAQYAHNRERDNSEEIALCMLSQNVSFLAGTGSRHFSARKDGRDLAEELKQKGYEVFSSVDQIPTKGDKTICLDDHLGNYATLDNIDDLATVTEKALRQLENPNGFFMMVEAAKIDHAGHANNISQSVLESMRLDALVKKALEFADQNGETLVVITGDHETGGLVLLDGCRKTGKVTAHWVSDDHTGVFIPVFAYGPSSPIFRGVYENTDVFNKISSLF